MTRTIKIVPRILCWVLLLGLAWALSAVWQSNAAAAEDAAANADAANAESDADPPKNDSTDEAAGNEESDSIGMLIVKSGWISVVFYVVLGAFSVVVMMIVLERLVNLRRAKVLPPPLAHAIHEASAGGAATAEDMRRISDTSDVPLARILKAGVLRAGRPLLEVEKAMEDAVARESAALRARNKPLSVIGNVAPLVGLLGTVVGIMFAFNAASQRGLGGGEDLAKGIYLALLTTAGGLTIAIPALLGVAWFNSRVERFLREIDQCLQETMPSFAGMENRFAAGRLPTAGQARNGDGQGDAARPLQTEAAVTS